MPPAPAGPRLRRLLVMIPWLTARRRVPLDEVAAAFDISRKQAEADVWLAGCLGVPPYVGGCNLEITIEDDDVVAHPQGYLARPPRLTPTEGLVLFAAGQALVDAGTPATTEPLRRALAKLESVLGAPGTVAVDLQRPTQLDEVQEAAREGRRLRITYYSAWRDEHSERAIDPHVVYQRRGRWYVDAHCHLAGGLRRFRVDRIEQLVGTGEQFEPVAAEPPDEVFQPGPNARRVVLDLPPSARWVVETYPVEWEEWDGGLRVTFHVLGDAWLERLLLRLGPDARVVEPPEAAPLAAAAARRLLAAYR